MELNESSRREEVSSAKTVQAVALAPGINGPTRNTLKSCILLGLCLAVILDLAFSSSTFLLLSRLEVVILNYMVKRGFHQTCEVFTREINVNPNPVAINSPEGYLQEWWNIFYEALKSSRFPEVALFAAESFDKVARTVENVVSNIVPVSSTYAPNHTGENISTVTTSFPMILSPHLMASSPVMASSGPDLMDPYISDFVAIHLSQLVAKCISSNGIYYS